MLWTTSKDACPIFGRGNLDQTAIMRMRSASLHARIPYVVNISMVEDFRARPLYYRHTYTGGPEGRGVVRAERKTKPALLIGTALHSAFELITKGKPLTEAVAEAVLPLHQAIAEAESFAVVEKLEWALPWIEDVAAVFHDRYGTTAGAEMSLLIEEPVWMFDPQTNVCVIGRPDFVGLFEGAVFHLQYKSRSKALPDAFKYAAKLSFSAHECVYGFILRGLLAEGQLGSENVDLPYGGSKILIAFKQAKPAAEMPDTPKTLVKGMDAGKIISITPEAIFLDGENCTEKQAADYQSMWSNWSQRILRWQDELFNWPEAVLKCVDADLDDEKIEQHTRLLLLSAEEMRHCDLKALGRVPCDTNQCEKFGEDCPFLEAHTCGGFDDLGEESGWTAREKNYVDEARATLVEFWGVKKDKGSL